MLAKLIMKAEFTFQLPLQDQGEQNRLTGQPGCGLQHLVCLNCSRPRIRLDVSVRPDSPGALSLELYF